MTNETKRPEIYLIGSDLDKSNFSIDCSAVRLIASLHRKDNIYAVFLNEAERCPLVTRYCYENKDKKINLNELLSDETSWAIDNLTNYYKTHTQASIMAHLGRIDQMADIEKGLRNLFEVKRREI